MSVYSEYNLLYYKVPVEIKNIFPNIVPTEIFSNFCIGFNIAPFNTLDHIEQCLIVAVSMLTILSILLHQDVAMQAH